MATDGTHLALWNHIYMDPVLDLQAKERLGYPTQKPLALLKRIIAASSNPDDTVLDPFCGCATACNSAKGDGTMAELLARLGH